MTTSWETHFRPILWRQRPSVRFAMARRAYYAYILSNAKRTVLYTGVTNDLRRRLTEHRDGTGSAFVRKYNVHDLVYFEEHHDVNDAIAREKQIKAGSRKKKDALIAAMNPESRDLSDELWRLD